MIYRVESIVFPFSCQRNIWFFLTTKSNCLRYLTCCVDNFFGMREDAVKRI